MRSLLLSRDAQKELSRLPVSVAKSIAAKILALREDPLPYGVKRLKSSKFYRLRCADYRIVYGFDAKSITVALIEKRDEVYRRTRRF